MDYKSGIIDLHIHSTASDGSFDPLEIPLIAKEAGLTAFALTDHDAIDGARQIQANRHLLGPVKFLTGVEISAAPPDFFNVSGSFHILGYGIHLDHPELNDALQRQQNARKNRNPQIIDRLRSLGFDLSLEEVVAASEEKAQIGRPHIARLMVKKGFVPSIDAAFDDYIGKGRPAYVDKPRIQTARALSLIQAAGGIAVLAHPGLLDVTDFNAYEYLLSELIPLGLKGLEAYYPGHSPEETHFFIQLAEIYGLLVTGGSDFHGAINPKIRVGTGTGDLAVPYGIYERLAAEINCLNASEPTSS